MKKIFTLVGALMLSIAAAAAFLNWGTSLAEGSDDFSFSFVRIVATSKATGEVLAFGEGTTIVGVELLSSQKASEFAWLMELDTEDMAKIAAAGKNGQNFFFEFYDVPSPGSQDLSTTGYSEILSYATVSTSIASQDLTRMMVTVHVAPEPSSGLLLLVGGALLGLRRRRRA